MTNRTKNMTNKVLTVGAALCCIVAATVGARAQEHTQVNNPAEISFGGDLPRAEIKSYNSRDYALRQLDDSSSYLGTLAGEWKVKTFAAAAQVDTALVSPGVDITSWSSTTVPERRPHSVAAAIYRRDFKVPFAWIGREVFIHAGAVDRAYYIYVNGQLAGYHEDSRTVRDFNVTRLVADGKNHIAVITYADPASATLEDQITDKGCALEQDLYVFTQPRVRIRDYVVDTDFDPLGTEGLLSFGAIVKSHLLNTRDVTVYCDLIGPDGEAIVTARRDARFDLRSEDTVRFSATVPNVKTWSHESPMLYTVALRIQHEGRYTEYMAVKVGFRKVVYDDKGLLINGRRFDIYAVDYNPPADGTELRSQFATMKKKGINMLHVNSFPQQNLFYDLCDAYGFYVCNQANIDTHLSSKSLAVGGTPANDTIWAAAYTDRVMNMYYTSRNHPSVVMYSLGKAGGRGYNMYEAYLALKGVEKERPVIYPDAGAEWNTDFVVGAPADRNSSDTRPAIIFYDPARTPLLTPPDGGMVALEQGAALGEITIRNNHSIANVSNFLTAYTVYSGRRAVREGSLTDNVPAGDRKTVSVPLDGLKQGKYTLKVTVARANTPEAISNGEVVAERSFDLNIPKPAK